MPYYLKIDVPFYSSQCRAEFQKNQTALILGVMELFVELVVLVRFATITLDLLIITHVGVAGVVLPQ